MKLSLVVTVLNEKNTIGKLIRSIAIQTKLPYEVIFVDGGSSDRTAQIILQESKKNLSLKIKLIKKKGNRSIGRNEGIRKAKGNIILSTDSGCTLDKNWVKNIIKPFRKKNVDVVAGYYRGAYKNIFQKSLIPYVLVMEDKIGNEFLPSTRSMAFRKSIWEKLGGFDEKLSHNEDYAFAIELKKLGCKIKFEKKAVVLWFPRSNLSESFIMFFRFAFGDIQANIIRTKVIFVFLRYIPAAYLFLLNFIMRSYSLTILTVLLITSYVLWSIYKNYKYVSSYKSFLYLPLLQFTSDIAILMGTTVGVIRAIKFKIIKNLIKKNIIVTFMVVAYILTTLSFIKWGIPGNDHPFAYHMDEWHQLASIKAIVVSGTPNIEGAAHGPIFHFLLSGLYLLPFVLLKIISPFSVVSPVTELITQARVFELLRLNTLFFGVGSVVLIGWIGKEHFRISPIVVSLLFTITPIWISLSNYFKYDIALIFWILAAIYFLFNFGKNKSYIIFILSGALIALAVATKISAAPLLIAYVVAFFLYRHGSSIKLKYIIHGLLIFLFIFILVGIPDVLLGKGDYYEFFYSNLISTPNTISNYILGMPWFIFLISSQFPTIFGHIFFYLFVISLAYFIHLLLKIKNQNVLIKKNYILLLIIFLLFFISILPLKLSSTGNRSLVLLPFISIITAISVTHFMGSVSRLKQKIFIFFMSAFIFIQVIETISWAKIKWSVDPRQDSSTWIQKNIKNNTTIGIENIPIYQMLPNIVIREFYEKKYGVEKKYQFKYEVVDYKNNYLPDVIIVSNIAEEAYLKSSPKIDLLNKLRSENYREVAQFAPDWELYSLFGNQINFIIANIVPVSTITVFVR